MDCGTERLHLNNALFNKRGNCSITAGARAEGKTGTAVYGAHVGGCAHVWPARARTVA